MPGVFLSYRRDDSAGYAGRLREALEERLGQGRVFRDVDTLEPGQDFVHAIDQRVGECRVFLALIGQDWLHATDKAGRRRLDRADDYVRREIASALNRSGVVVIPVLTEGVEMPAADQLPEELRPLARRHAISLRDESWQADVDRLAAVLEKALDAQGSGAAERPRPRNLPPWFRYATTRVALVALAIVIAWLALRRVGGGIPTGGTGPDSATLPGAGTIDPDTSAVAGSGAFDPAGGGAVGTDATGSGADGGARALRLEVPRLSEIILGDNLYTLLWASLTPRGDVNRLRLRLRFVNEGRYGVNFSAAAFRLAAGNRVLVPVDGPERVVPTATIDHDAVTFDVPAGANRVTLRVLGTAATAELPLDLTPLGPVQPADTADPGDALSRAVRSALPVSLPETLLSAEGVTFTLTSASLRRFVNVTRIAFGFRFENATRYSVALSGDAFRLLAGRDALAPVNLLSEVGEPDATRHFDLLFEVPPETREVMLRLRYGEQAPAERKFALSPGPSRSP
jgi:hypothetical protein